MRQAQFTTLAVHLALVLSALLAVSPFAYLAIGSLQNPVDSSLSFNNFRALGDLRILRWLTNSLFVASAHTVLVVILSSLGGFALAKYRFRGQFAIQGLMVATMLIPSQLIVPGLYDIVLGLGWADRFVAVIVPSMVSAFGILLFRQAFIQIPDELLDAARLDGARPSRRSPDDRRVYFDELSRELEQLSLAANDSAIRFKIHFADGTEQPHRTHRICRKSRNIAGCHLGEHLAAGSALFCIAR